MRIIRAILVALMLASIAFTVVFARERDHKREEVLRSAARARERLELEIKYRAATGQVTVNGRGWPLTIDPQWFGTRPPDNPYVTPDRPWIEVASPEEALLKDPALRLAIDDSLAAFWYNPANGIVRARIGQTLSDRQALELYNRVNNTHLTSIFDSSERPVISPETTTTDARASEKKTKRRFRDSVVVRAEDD